MQNSTKIKILILVLIFGCGMFWSSGRGILEGTVKNAGGDTVADANVTTSPKAYTATTDSEGNYTIADIDVGEYTVSASYGSLSGSSTTVVGAGGFFSCKGKEATCDITLSATGTAGWVTLTSPLDGTYSGEGFYLTEANSPYDVTGDVVFHQTNVEIENNVTINIVYIYDPFDQNRTFLFGENTNITFGNNIAFTRDSSMGFYMSIDNGSKITLNKVTFEATDLKIKREADIENCIFYGIDIWPDETNLTYNIKNCNFRYNYLLSFRNSGNAVVSYCNIGDISVGTDFTVTVNNCNFPEPPDIIPGMYPNGEVFMNYSANPVDATNNWWLTTDTTTISDCSIYDYYNDNSYGIVSFEPIQGSTVTTAGPQ